MMAGRSCEQRACDNGSSGDLHQFCFSQGESNGTLC
jgi:hypothetical protein